jgi:hypothetical protein
LPPSTILQAMLRKITERFARELAEPAPLAPEWSEFEWIVARAVAAMHGVSPLLSRTLCWQGPVGWAEFLEEQRTHTTRRHMRIADLLQRLDRGARETGVAAVALKGASLHAMGLYTAGDRPMADIDVLVRPRDVESAGRLLTSLGFRQTRETWKEREFAPVEDHIPGEFGENADNSVKIELHDRICERLPWRITDMSERIFPPHPQPGLQGYPSQAAMMIHLLLHAAGSMTIRALRLLHLHDLARVSSRMTERDWDEMLALGSRDGRMWWAFPPLILTSRYYAATIPGRVLEALAKDCPYLLKTAFTHTTLHDVSCSYLWVEAFPGIRWSRSIREVLEYAMSRVRPDAGQVALRQRVADTQACADRGPWSRLSQGRRILRWITAAQMRPLTMHSVHAALAKAQ